MRTFVPNPRRVSLLAGLIVSSVLLTGGLLSAAETPPNEARPPANDTELRYWLWNMKVWHRYTTEEMSAATGLTTGEVSQALARFGTDAEPRSPRKPTDPLRVLPFPGGRHPRIGFLEGAIRPQRETKISVFTPWDESSYVIVDVPEAIWSNLGLTYLAHTHIDTVWSKQGVALPKLEWNRLKTGTLEIERTLPNGIAFGAKIVPRPDAVLMELWLRNGSAAALSDLRVQNCVMLKNAAGFNQQTNANKVLRNPYLACRNAEGDRWIITAWTPCHRPWANAPVPCLHSDPKFPDCAPGETKRLRGWLSFYEGKDLDGELRRIENLRWDK